jgi:cytidylate kinase
MNVITVSREYGAGGGEVARRLAEVLGWELLDRELLHRAAAVEHVPDAELERLDEQALSLLDHFRLHPPHERYMHGLTAATRQAAARRNVILVGRGTRQILGAAPNAFHLRLVAPLEWRAQRMATREGWPLAEAQARCAAVERTRERFMRYFFGAAVGPEQYDVVVNSGRVALDTIVEVVAAVVRGEPTSPMAAARPRVLTASRELGAGGTTILPAVAQCLGLRLLGRELLEEEAVRLGVPAAELKPLDERPSGVWRRLSKATLVRSSVQTLATLMHEHAARGNVLLVGRGGNHLLRDVPTAVHVRLVAPLPFRVRRVMRHQWMREAVALNMIAESDAERRSYAEAQFATDWADPLEYDWTVNGSRPADQVVDLIARAALRQWQQLPA